MKIHKRKPNRPISTVKTDIEDTNKILREDIYDILKTFKEEGKSKEEALEALKGFIEALDKQAINKYIKRHETTDRIYARIASDINSYGIKWDEP